MPPRSLGPELPEGVLATGSFQGGAQGAVQLVNNGDGMLTVRVEGFRIDFARYSGVTAVPYPTYPDERCGNRFVAWDFGYEQEGVVPEVYQGQFPLDAFAGDPSLIRELIIRATTRRAPVVQAEMASRRSRGLDR